MRSLLLLLLLLFIFFSCTEKKTSYTDPSKIKISWADSLPGDFSFKEEWDYPEGIYVNEFGQVSCDGFCPETAERMKDEKGKICKDSLAAFYYLVDTSHFFHSIQCDAWCYEYAGENFLDLYKTGEETYACNIRGNAGTHCFLQMKLQKDTCTPQIKLASVIKGRDAIFNCIDGTISIEKEKLRQGILKAVFDFKFKNTTDSLKPVYWKGKIYSKIDQGN
jgi:hypothetical protein